MLEERHYMSNSGSFSTKWWTSATALIFFANLAAFILQNINHVYVGSRIERELMLNADSFFRGHVWQIVTFQFLHWDTWHFFINSLMLYMFGRPVEMAMGRARFFEVYFASGVAGGLLQVSLGLVIPTYFGGSVAGASAGVSGIIAAFCLLFRNETIRLMFILPMRALTLLWVALGFAAFFVLVPSERGIAHAAHLGGMLAAMAYERWILRSERRLFDWRQFADVLRSRRVPRRDGPIIKVRFPKPGPRSSAPNHATKVVSDTDFMSKEVDPILDKIRAHGIQSLTEREKQILESARARMGKH